MALSDTEKHLDRSSGWFEPVFGHHEGSSVQVGGSVVAGFAIHGVQSVLVSSEAGKRCIQSPLRRMRDMVATGCTLFS